MERTAGDLLKGFGELPSVVALEFTSQKAHVFLEIGMLLVVLTAVGAVALWRRGRRFPAAALAIYFLALLIVGGGPRAMRERYFMPLLPLMAWCMIAGMCSCAGWLACRLRRNPHRAAVAAVTILVLFLIGANQPKVARGAFYYSYLAHIGQYYDHLQNRPYVELMAVSKLVNDRTPAPAEVAMTPDRISVLHYVTGRRITQLPLGPQTTADDATAAGAAITKETATAVFGIEKASDVFRRRLSDEMLAAGFEQRYAGSFYMAYCRLPPRAEGDSR
jgi:uncharacterized membrane protein (UPF0136 family)